MTDMIFRRQKGIILIELLVAVMLTGIAGLVLYSGFIQGARAYERILENKKNFNEPKIFLLRLEEDLKNMVNLREYPFQGSSDEIRFPALLAAVSEKNSEISRLMMIRYFLRGDQLIREEEEITSRLIKPELKKRSILSGINSIRFFFPREDEKGNISFEPFWLEEPYAGLPRAVRVRFDRHGMELLKTVSILQGRFGIPEKQGASLQGIAL